MVQKFQLVWLQQEYVLSILVRLHSLHLQFRIIREVQSYDELPLRVRELQQVEVYATVLALLPKRVHLTPRRSVRESAPQAATRVEVGDFVRPGRSVEE